MNITIGAAAILNRHNRILLGKRSILDSHLPGLWCIPGGKIELLENINQCIERETFEEVRLEVTVYDSHKAFVAERILGGSHTILIGKKVSLVDTYSAAPIAGDGFDDVMYFTIEELRGMVELGKLTQLTVDILRQYFAEEGATL